MEYMEVTLYLHSDICLTKKNIDGCVSRITPFVNAPFGKSFVERIRKIQGVNGQESHSSYVKNNVACCLFLLLFCNSGIFLPFFMSFLVQEICHYKIFSYWVSSVKSPVIEGEEELSAQLVKL